MDIIEHSLIEFRKRSFYLDKALASECLVLFMKTDGGVWFALTIGEGEYILSIEESEPKITPFNEIDYSFSYPIEILEILFKYKGLTLKNIMTYKLIDDTEYCIGIYLKFESEGLSIIENENNLTFYNGISTEALKISQLIDI